MKVPSLLLLSMPCPGSHSSFALAPTLKWVGYERAQWSEPAKIITIFLLLDPLSVGSVPRTDLPSGHTRARNCISGGRTTIRGEREDGRFDSSPSWDTVGWHSLYFGGGYVLLDTSQKNHSMLYSPLPLGREILPLDKYITILLQLGEVTSKIYISYIWCDAY